MDPDLRCTLNQVIYVAPLTGRSSSGTPTFGTPESMKARVEKHQRRIESDKGEKLTTHRIYTEGEISMRDRLWLPGVFSDALTVAQLAKIARHPLAVVEEPDEDGSTSHFEVLV